MPEKVNVQSLQDNNGDWCKSEDVEKLEQLNAEMLAIIKAIYKTLFDNNEKESSIIASEIKSIIRKNEA